MSEVPLYISVKVLINCFRCNEIYYTSARLLLASICVVFFAAETQFLNTSMEIQVQWRRNANSDSNHDTALCRIKRGVSSLSLETAYK